MNDIIILWNRTYFEGVQCMKDMSLHGINFDSPCCVNLVDCAVLDGARHDGTWHDDTLLDGAWHDGSWLDGWLDNTCHIYTGWRYWTWLDGAFCWKFLIRRLIIRLQWRWHRFTWQRITCLRRNIVLFTWRPDWRHLTWDLTWWR